MRLTLVAAVFALAVLTWAACEASTPNAPAAGPNAVEITVTTAPPGASVVVDGVVVGESPAKVKLNPGPHRARASMSGYYPPPEARFQVGASEPTTVTIPLVASH